MYQPREIFRGEKDEQSFLPKGILSCMYYFRNFFKLVDYFVLTDLRERDGEREKHRLVVPLIHALIG